MLSTSFGSAWEIGYKSEQRGGWSRGRKGGFLLRCCSMKGTPAYVFSQRRQRGIETLQAKSLLPVRSSVFVTVDVFFFSQVHARTYTCMSAPFPVIAFSTQLLHKSDWVQTQSRESCVGFSSDGLGAKLFAPPPFMYILKRPDSVFSFLR